MIWDGFSQENAESHVFSRQPDLLVGWKRWPRHPACKRHSCEAFSAGGKGLWLLCGFVKKDYAEGLNHVWSGFLVNISMTWSQIVVQDRARHSGWWHPSTPHFPVPVTVSTALGRGAVLCQPRFCFSCLVVHRGGGFWFVSGARVGRKLSGCCKWADEEKDTPAFLVTGLDLSMCCSSQV